MENKPKQLEAKIIGDKGCYFLSIINSVCRYLGNDGNSFDIIKFYELCMEEKWLLKDCWVERPDLIAAFILGVDAKVLSDAGKSGRGINEVKVSKESMDYIPKDNEIEITRYEKESTGVTFSHFVETRNGEVIYDPYGNSSTVAKGKAVSKRILTINV